MGSKVPDNAPDATHGETFATSIGGTPVLPTAAAVLGRGRLKRLERSSRLAFVGIGVVVASALVSGPKGARDWIVTGFAAAVAVTYGIISLWVGRGREVSHFVVRSLGPMSVSLVLVLILQAGVFSPMVMGLFVTVIYWGLTDDVADGFRVYLMSAVGYLVLGSLAVAGVIDVTESLVPLGPVGAFQLAVTLVVIEVVLALVYKLARDTRRATLDALNDVERAQQDIRQRDALLHEARADLDRVVDAGRAGRYTGIDLGPYRAAEVIGRGGGGEVYRAVEHATGNAVAIKIMPPELIDDAEAVRRFFREIEVSQRLHSPHIVRILGSGRAPDGAPYFSMELLEGRDLSAALRNSQRLEIAQVTELVSQVARALTVAADAGIVHRDLKPQNLFLASQADGAVWKVLDFGISKIEGGGATIAHGMLIGTPSYMAPEQVECSTNVDHRADVFALGVIAYRALTGRPPFTGRSFAETVYNVQHVQPARPSQLVELPRDIDFALALALAKNPEERLSSAATFAAVLSDAARGKMATSFRNAARGHLAVNPWWSPEETIRERV